MKTIVLVLLACCMAVSCGGKKEVKQVSQESKTTKEAFALTETIRNAFINKDLPTIQRNASDEGYREITANRKVFDSVGLTFTPRWVEIEGSRLLVNIAWKSSWALSGRKVEERGMAVFVMEGNPLKVIKILQTNPFVFPDK